MTGSQKDRVWVGVDIGKSHHWVCVIDGEGKVLLSRKVGNDHGELADLVQSVAAAAQQEQSSRPVDEEVQAAS